MDQTTFRSSVTRMWLALALIAGVIAGLRLASMLRDGAYSYTTGTEEMSIFNLSRIQEGAEVYVDPFRYPYRTSLYNWLFYDSHAWIVKWLSPSALELPTVLRLTTLAWAALGCLVSFALLLRHLNMPGRGWCAFSIAFVAWFGPSLGWWTMTARPDVAALACAVSALALTAGSNSACSPFRALAAGLLFFLAWSFKQSEVGILLGVGTALLYRREWLAFTLLTLTFGVLTALTLGLGSEEYLANVLILPRLSHLDPGQAPPIVITWLRFEWGFVVPVILFLLVRAVPEERRRNLLRLRTLSMFAIVLVVTTVVGLVTILRYGAWTNYFFPAGIVGTLLAGLLTPAVDEELPEQKQPTEARRAFGVLYVLLPALATGLILMLFRFPPDMVVHASLIEVPSCWLPGRPYEADVLEAVRDSTGPIFSEDLRLVLLARDDAGSVPVPENCAYALAADAGRLKDGGIATHIDRRWFGTLWLVGPDSVWEPLALESGYRLDGQMGRLRKFVRAAP